MKSNGSLVLVEMCACERYALAEYATADNFG